MEKVMDNEKGKFEELTDKQVKEVVEKHGEEAKQIIFQKKEIVKVKGSDFRIRSIGSRVMTLTLLPKIEEEKKQEETPSNAE